MSWVQNSQQTSEHQSKSVLSDGTSGDRLGYPLCTREREQMSPRVVRLAFTNRLAHQKPSRRRPQSTRRPETSGEAWRRHSGRPGIAEELLVRSYYQFNTASYSKLRSEVWSGNLKYRAGRLRGNRLCRTFSFSRGTCFSPSRQRRVPECACSFPQRRAVGAASWARIGRTKYDMAVAESA
ncbi:Hypothetical_protein [Hexamita inflata]|uniref:Hypothetical_protein n=1 Tax=Hexamita inflata TaxID=28002 RepID=A0AA86RM51_9EUKA|nr:Hypothetical protein HINF_LOCUS63758 [Hexamita inflata]